MSDPVATLQTCGHIREGRGTPCAEPAGHTDDHHDGDGRTWFNYGPIQHYEVIWMSGHVESIHAHQVIYPDQTFTLLASYMGSGWPKGAGPPRIHMHGEINGHWVLTLSAHEQDIRSIRLVTAPEPIPDDRSGVPSE